MMKLLQQLSGIDPQQTGEGSFRFGDPWPGLLTLVVGLGLAWLFFRLYGTETGRASKRYRTVLALLRTTAALLLLFMLFRPVRVVEKTEERESVVVVLLDDSMSMALKDKYGDSPRASQLRELAGLHGPDSAAAQAMDEMTRAELVSRLLSNRELKFFESLRKAGRIRVYTFSHDLAILPVSGDLQEKTAGPGGGEEGPSGDTAPADEARAEIRLRAEGPSTRLGEALARAADDLRGQFISGLIVVTDGQSNSGRSPEEAVEEKAVRRDPPFPVFPVGVGTTTSPRDIEVLEVLANEAVFVNDEVVFSLLLGHRGMGGQKARIHLKRDGELVEDTEVTIRPEGASQEVKIRHVPRAIGQFTYEVSVPPLEGESLTENNRRTQRIRVVDDRVKVLYVSDLPSWEYRYLKNALVRDHSVEVSCLLQSADAEFIQEGSRPIQRFPSGPEELYPYDVVVFTDADFGRLSDVQQQAIVGFAGDLGGGVLFAVGPLHGLDGIKGGALEKLLPVHALSNGALKPGPFTESFAPQLTPDGLRHPILRLEGDPEENAKRWRLLPEVFWYLPVRSAKPGALTLAVHPFERNDSGNHVLLAAQIYGAGRTVFLATDSTWRWRNPVGDLYFYRFWGQSIRFLSAGRLLGQSRRIHLLTDRSTYHLGDDVLVTARLLDEFYRPVERPEVAAEVRTPDGGTEKLMLQGVSRRAGAFEGTFRPTSAGPYEVILDRVGEGEAGVSRSFTVTVPLLELDHPELNESLLRKLAEVSRGHYFSLEEIGQIPDKISQRRESSTREEEDPLWDSPLVLILFASLLIVEWILRKRAVMV
ncbi:MAG: hypothetical protein HYU36_18660 [Planctomycetes bacterium]|nr:hypothetical protein [Planctomycetota bacterium]